MMSSDTYNRKANQDSFEFWSAGDSFGLRVYRRDLEEVVDLCRKAHPKETGGIIIGTYTAALDCAVVANFTVPPKDSRFGTTWFRRGVMGLKRILNAAWRRNEFYLGEWHFHPNGEPIPSSTDRNQLAELAGSIMVNCAEPILLILGGDPKFQWKIQTFVSPRNKTLMEMFAVAEPRNSEVQHCDREGN